MPSERFYIDAPLEGDLFLEGQELHHLAHVMRIRVGEEIELVNGKGGLAVAKVTAIGKKEATLHVLSAKNEKMPKKGLTLALPLLKGNKLEFVVEKCTELGVSAFVFFSASSSEKEKLSENQLQRLSYIAISAMKQCGRLDLPELSQVKNLTEVLKMPGPHFFGDLRASDKWHVVKEALFITGPEGGFSQKELKLLEEKATPVLLHQNTLRAETAPIAAACYYSFSS
jgi:16S rRNA (uracil1498-N3)-methyltransferase